ncbi:UrcA family protein [Povalibacter uvarum]|uniref:UrcA family protein n=1 Tax=Povalibacter uvarum TaxID=732238 RepID=A0A841HK37_9GAMM|nr:UrcA family protein [Povalibacter uvarum]MBB6093176.1 UrcA family protein [Povalibacter uvarum]
MSFKSTVTSTIASVIGVAAFSLVAASAQAAESPAPRITVQLADFDLSKSKDAKALYTRLRSAARGVCSSIDGNDLRSRRDNLECKQSALDNAVDEVGNAQLSALHRSESGIRIASRNASDRS